MVIPEGVVRTKLDIYQMVDTSASGVLVIEGITRPVVSTLVIEGITRPVVRTLVIEGITRPVVSTVVIEGITRPVVRTLVIELMDIQFSADDAFWNNHLGYARSNMYIMSLHRCGQLLHCCSFCRVSVTKLVS
jgi:hypothetical protein